MGYLGTKPANQIIDSTLIADGVITTSDLANGAVTDAKIAAMAASKLTGQVPDANAPSGSVIQVVTNSTTSLITSSGSEVTILTQSITPLSASSKFFIIANSTYIDNNAGGRDMQIRFKRNSTVLSIDTATAYTYYNYGGTQIQNPFNGMFLDSPATTSAITYGVFLYSNSATAISGCQLIIMEIAG
jgi:hypothetical protein